MRHTIVAAALGALFLAAPAQAETRTHYRLTGNDTKRGGFSSSITLVDESGKTEVIRWGIYSEGTTIQRAWTKRRADGTIHVTIRDMPGVSGVLSGTPRAKPTTITLTIEGQRIKSVTASSEGNGEANGAVEGLTPTPQPAPQPAPQPGGSDRDDDDDDPNLLGKIKQKGKHLLAAAEKKVKKLIKKEKDKLVYDGVKLEETFKLSKYFHVGVGGKIEALRQSELTPEQALTLRQKPRHVWLSNHVHGGVRIPLSTSIPVGSVNIGIGLDSQAKVDYQVVDIYPLPDGVTDVRTAIADLKTVAKRSFDLPLDASEAEAMNVGAVRVFDGQGSIAISGNLSVGREVGNQDGVVRVGASARVGGFYRIQGDVRITVERLKFSQARVRVRHGDTASRGVSADLFLGASVNMDKLKDELEPVVEYIDEALIDKSKLPSSVKQALLDAAEDELADTVRDKIRKVLRVRLYGGRETSKRDEIDVSFVMNLSQPKARKAYERAVRGDFTEAAKQAIVPESGVRREFRVVSVENRTYNHASLELSILFKASASKEIRFRDLHVDDENGRTDYEVFTFNRKRDIDLSLISKRWKKDLNVEVIRSTRPGTTLTEDQIKRSFRITLDHMDGATYRGQTRRRSRLVASWGLNMESALPMPEWRGPLSRYGQTRTRIEVAISEKGIAAILAQGRAKMFKAYADAYGIYKGKQPRWATASGQSEITSEITYGDGNRTFAEQEKAEWDRAEAFVRGLQGLNAARTPQERAARLKDVANSARYDLYTVSALIYLAPRETLTLDASIHGERIQVNDGRVGGAYAVPVVDYR